MKLQLVLLCTLSSVAYSVEVTINAIGLDDTGTASLPSFASFISMHSRTYAKGSKEFSMRHSIYERRLREIQHQNSIPHRRWNAVVNHLSDRTEAELSQLRGLRIVQPATRSGARGVAGFNRHGGQFLGQVRSTVVPEEKSWMHLNAVKQNINQEACGSCWAVATSIMLQANAEINGYNRSFSAQELVNCVPNPHNCGGNGGCTGSTVELAMNWVMSQGLETLDSTPYVGTDQACAKTSPALLSTDQDGISLEDMIAVGFHPAKGLASAGLKLGLQGWERLPENEYQPLLRAVAEHGPVAVSVAADAWEAYGSGIFDSCDSNAEIDHAVTLVGYGNDGVRNAKYWTIKNSWGTSWGEESGTIRLLRHEGNVHCGTDSMPQIGTGCDGGPSSVRVCGMCGILYDAVVPHFHKSK